MSETSISTDGLYTEGSVTHKFISLHRILVGTEYLVLLSRGVILNNVYERRHLRIEWVVLDIFKTFVKCQA